ncbi:hypothetical protein C7T94_08020 [Pedobacter yulinensis]|uniref:Uncharacterized protein n=1 Tax=Pedobacter yulinensis TaxID=2126353 RepID=A0A2T3HJN7_9SPHI|nr:hypothetical protein [Pedobacter yulinensis]PST82603.1 hypothetical protein C7T94_08020 [Pedobacter yulinensis]
MKPAFNYLYSLKGNTICIVEIRKTGLPAAAPHESVYQWLLIDLNTLQVQPLAVRSIDSSGLVQERFFEQGYLKFDDNRGTFIEKFNVGQHQLSCIDPSQLPEPVASSITFHLSDKQLGIPA